MSWRPENTSRQKNGKFGKKKKKKKKGKFYSPANAEVGFSVQ